MGGSEVGLAMGMGMRPSMGVHRYGTGQGFHAGAGDERWNCGHRSWGRVGGLFGCWGWRCAVDLSVQELEKHAGHLVGCMLDGKGCITIVTNVMT